MDEKVTTIIKAAKGLGWRSRAMAIDDSPIVLKVLRDRLELEPVSLKIVGIPDREEEAKRMMGITHAHVPNLGHLSFEKGARLAGGDAQYYAVYKPVGTLSTPEDRHGSRPTVFDMLSEKAGVDYDGFYPLGRLDLDAHGLMILTNDGSMASILMRTLSGSSLSVSKEPSNLRPSILSGSTFASSSLSANGCR